MGGKGMCVYLNIKVKSCMFMHVIKLNAKKKARVWCEREIFKLYVYKNKFFFNFLQDIIYKRNNDLEDFFFFLLRFFFFELCATDLILRGLELFEFIKFSLFSDISSRQADFLHA